MKWKVAVVALFVPFLATESVAVILAWLASGFRALALVFKRFGQPVRYAAKRAQGFHWICGAWVKPGSRTNRRRTVHSFRGAP